MSMLKKLAAVTLCSALVMSVASIQAAALKLPSEEKVTAELSTDKTDYGKDDQVTVKMTLANNYEKPITSVDMQQLAPDGYVLVKTIENNTGRTTADVVEAGNTLEVVGVYEKQADPEEASKEESKEASKEASKETSKAAEQSKPTTNTQSAAATKAVDTVATGDGTSAIVLAVIALLSVVLVIYCVKNKKGKELLSIAVCISVAGTIFAITGLNVSATDDPEVIAEPKTTTTKTVPAVAVPAVAAINCDGAKYDFNGLVTYKVDEEFVTISGIVYDAAGEPAVGAKIEVSDIDGNVVETAVSDANGYSIDLLFIDAQNYTITFTKDDLDPIVKSIIDVKENRVINAKFDDVSSGMYSQYFSIDPIVSKYGDALIDEYGVRVDVNEGATIRKCAVYMREDSDGWRRTIAIVGDNITEAKYVPYLCGNEVLHYDGTMPDIHINTFSLSQSSDGIWNVGGIYDMIHVNLVDKDNNLLTLGTKNIVGRNCKIFDNLDDMKAWLLAE